MIVSRQQIRRPVGIDLFAGAGGFSLGFEQAGFDVIAAVEIDPIHACVHKYNFPCCTVIPNSVVGLTGREIRRAADIGDLPIDVIFGGAPCQGFSLIGHRALDDPRNSLVREFVRIVSELNPNFFVFENVKGLTIGKHRRFLAELIEAFHAVKYTVRVPWRVLNSIEYGVPQDRERLFLIGAKAGHPVPEYPSRLTRRTGSHEELFALPEGPSCQDAIGDLPDAEEFEELRESDAVCTDNWGEPSAYSSELRCLDERAWYLGYPRRWEPSLLTCSMRTDHTTISRKRFHATAPGSVEPISRFYKLSPAGVSNTLRAGTDSARGAFTSPRPIHYERQRCITVREMARLHGFPDWFRFHATKWHGARQIGNAVPPPLARAVAHEISRVLGVNPPRPWKVLELGSPELLKMDMKRAASYWHIQIPIGRRDKKSGAKKRKQIEIEASIMSRL